MRQIWQNVNTCCRSRINGFSLSYSFNIFIYLKISDWKVSTKGKNWVSSALPEEEVGFCLGSTLSENICSFKHQTHVQPRKMQTLEKEGPWQPESQAPAAWVSHIIPTRRPMLTGWKGELEYLYYANRWFPSLQFVSPSWDSWLYRGFDTGVIQRQYGLFLETAPHCVYVIWWALF